jgi:DNA-binding MarR family transcriptional regulator
MTATTEVNTIATTFINVVFMKYTFLRFLHLKEVLSGHQVEAEIDLTAQKLLEVVCLRHDQQKPLTVSEAMQLQSIASPATLHRKLSALLEHGYVQFVFEGTNRRTKYIHPTAKTDAYFEALGQVLQQSLA